MAVQINPPKAQQPKSYQEYLKSLDELLKRNTGKGLYVGEDVSSNIPMYLPGKVKDPTGLGGKTPSIDMYGDGMTEKDTPDQLPTGDVLGDQGQMSAVDYLNKWTQDYQNPEPTIQGIQSTQDGGVLATDGNIYYSDGTMRSGDADAYAYQSLPGGAIRYSDGSVREAIPYEVASLGYDQDGTPLYLYSDGQVRYGSSTGEIGEGGVSALIKGIFGQDRPITQEYGNINPIEPTPGNVNIGTDIRTKDLQGGVYKIPVNAEVVQVYKDDGTRFGDQSGHKGYGNSILLRLPSGEMLRFSHMGEMANVQVGDTISAGQVFGTPGQTGNTYGEHLDLEYYNEQGQASNPSEFKGFPKDDKVGQLAPDPRQQPPQQTTQPTMDQKINEQKTNEQTIPQQVKEAAVPGSVQRQALGQTVQEASPIKTELGIGETISQGPEAGREARVESLQQSDKTYNPFRQLLGNVTERIGDTLGIPEGVFSEAIAGGPTKRTNLALASEIGVNKSQEVPGIRQNIKDIGGEIKQFGEDALARAGEGVSNLASSAVSSLQNVFKPKQDVAKRAVGDVKGTAEPAQSGQFSSVMDTASSMANLPKNDIRDPFFKMGGADMFKSFLSPGVDSKYKGALGLDTFTSDFYKDLGNISSVFGGSKDLSPAVNKYIEFEKQKYPKMGRMSYQEGIDNGAVDDYNRQVDQYNAQIDNYLGSILGSVAASPSIFKPRLQGTAKNVFGTPSKSNAPVSGKQLNLSSFAPPTRKTPPVQAPPVTVVDTGAKTTSNTQGVQNQTTTKQQPVVSAGVGGKTITTTINKQPVAFDFTTYSSAPSAQKAPAAQSKPTNVFKSAAQAVKKIVTNIFRR